MCTNFTIQNCIYVKEKEQGYTLLIDFMIEQNMIAIDSESAKQKVPDIITFLIVYWLHLKHLYPYYILIKIEVF